MYNNSVASDTKLPLNHNSGTRMEILAFIVDTDGVERAMVALLSLPMHKSVPTIHKRPTNHVVTQTTVSIHQHHRRERTRVPEKLASLFSWSVGYGGSGV